MSWLGSIVNACAGFTLLVMLALPAQAQTCTPSMTAVAFGEADVLSGLAIDTAGTLDLSCSGTAGQTIRVCANIGARLPDGTRHMTSPSASTELSFDHFSDAARAMVWGSYEAGGTGVQLDVVLNGTGNGSASRTAYVRLYGNQQSAGVGNYSLAFEGSTSNITYAYGTMLNCNSITINRTAMVFTATATVSARCLVSANNLNFGQVTLLTQNVDAAGSITIRCTASSPYSVGLDGGLSQAAIPTHRKLSFAQTTITYGLYRDSSRQSPWGATQGVDRAQGVGNASDQILIVYGRVAPQPTPPPGFFTDTVVIAIDF
jgi:spore coat protein U-like protein